MTQASGNTLFPARLNVLNPLLRYRSIGIAAAQAIAFTTTDPGASLPHGPRRATHANAWSTPMNPDKRGHLDLTYSSPSDAKHCLPQKMTGTTATRKAMAPRFLSFRPYGVPRPSPRVIRSSRRWTNPLRGWSANARRCPVTSKPPQATSKIRCGAEPSMSGAALACTRASCNRDRLAGEREAPSYVHDSLQGISAGSEVIQRSIVPQCGRFQNLAPRCSATRRGS
jgi:hypothetical protein